MSLWNWADLVAAVNGRAGDVAPPALDGVAIDSRLAVPGDLFVALTGDPGPRFNVGYRSNRDGHDYVAAAFANGAAAALVHRQVDAPVPQILVKDTLDGLWDLGRAARQRFHQPVLAVTGSSGKTTCKAMLSAALGGFATSGSLNNHLGVPLSLARTPADAVCAIYEIGTNHPGEIAPLSRLARPDVAIVLNVHLAHAANFASRADIEVEKLSISSGLQENSHLIIEESLALPEGPWEIIRFGTSAGADVRLLNYAGDLASYSVFGREVSARVPGGGLHRATTLAAVIAAVHAAGSDVACATDLADAVLPEGRGTSEMIAGVRLVDDSYNANPSSIRASITSWAAQPGDRHIAVVGEMLELGPDSAAHHRDLAVVCAGLDLVFCVGAGAHDTHKALPSDQAAGYFDRADADLLDALMGVLQPGDSVLLKGSNRVFWKSGFADKLRARIKSDLEK
ncbi:MAG: Mur ligase family protein [Proteobacteria bacterium]|nr:Mur ligase family protein [Pseudomonadota bacterium]